MGHMRRCKFVPEVSVQEALARFYDRIMLAKLSAAYGAPWTVKSP